MTTPRRRVLFLTPQLPYPPHQGTAIRNWHLVQQVAARHAVDVLSFASDPDEALAQSGPLAEICGRVVALPTPPRSTRQRIIDLLRGYADMARRLYSPAFAARLAAWLADGYDIIQAEGI